jgi:hypothetical protein
MSASHGHRANDDLPDAVIAAIVAALAALDAPTEETSRGDISAWARSGRVAPSWHETGRNCWSTAERERGWR